MIKASTILACAVLGTSLAVAPVAAPGASATPSYAWVKRTPAASPPGRGGTAMAYDAAGGRVLLFGGRSGGSYLNDTWEWDGTTWTQRTPATSPPGREYHAMAYRGGQVVLFGGRNSSSQLRDTWIWDGTNWTQRTPATLPPARSFHSMALSGFGSFTRIVMFGGFNGFSDLGDTWEWDGGDWRAMSPFVSPSARYGPTMVHIPSSGDAILFGGSSLFGDVGADTWRYTSGDWVQYSVGKSPPGRAYHTMAWDAGRSRVVVFGGQTSGAVNDTWEFPGGEAWTQRLPAASPPAGTTHVMTYDGARGRIVLFTGSETWELVVQEDFPPDTTITSGPASTVNRTTATFAFTSNDSGATFECRVDQGAYASCSSSHTVSVSEGAHIFKVRALNATGNADVSVPVHFWTVDTTPPQTTITSAPPGVTNNTSATFQFGSSESGSNFACTFDGGNPETCTTPRSYGGLVDGIHTFTVRATDGVGNTDASPATYSWTIDTVPPDVTITDGPSGPTPLSDVTFEFTASETAGTRCSLDGSGPDRCNSPVTYEALAEGEHEFQVFATDDAGNEGISAPRTFTVDLTAPDTTIVGGPSGTTGSASAAFTFSSTEAGTFRCSLDAGAEAGCDSPHNLTALAGGGHTFRVYAVDEAGNADPYPAERSWSIDLTAPETTITSGPFNPTNWQSATFQFTATEAGAFSCSLDSAPFSACTTPVNLSSLAEGGHAFEVRATDLYGNVDTSPARWTWTVDLTPPDTTISSAPPAFTSSRSASFAFGSTEPAGATFECSLDAAQFTACTSPQAYASLAEGAHAFRVRAVDAAGNTDPSPASRSWTVDFTSPETTIVSGPVGTSGPAQVSFGFTSGEAGSTFECMLDGGSWGGCVSPKTYPSLGGGPHTFGVRAIDAAGNVDSSPATRSWTVDATDPTVSIVRPGPGVYVLDGQVQQGGPFPIVAGPVTIEGRGADASGICEVNFEIDGRAVNQADISYDPARDVYRYLWRPEGAGSRTISFRAYDCVGNSARTSQVVLAVAAI